MKRLFIFMAAMSCCSISANATDITVEEAMSAEIMHEQQVQIQIEQLQKAREAAFIKQLEAESLIEQQRLIAEGKITPEDLLQP